MKIARFFAGIFAFLGTVLMVGTIGLCLFSLNAPVKLKDMPEEALNCAQEMMDALAAGEFAAASEKIYGQPDLGMTARPRTAEGQLVWDAYVSSISYEFTGEHYVKDGHLCRDAVITTLDIPSVTAQWNGGVHTFLTARIQAAEDAGELMELYDENNDFRPEVVDGAVREAVEYSLKNGAQAITTEVTLQIICRDGAWWVVPDSALLTSLFGGLT